MSAYRPAGYAALIERYHLEVIPNWHISFVATETQMHKIEKDGNTVREHYPEKYWPGESVGEQLEFALKYDGVNLAILFSIFHVMDEKEFLDYLHSKPTGKYARRLWYLYEFLTGKKLPIDDIKQGNYVDLLDKERYYTLDTGRSIKRQRIRDNQLGDEHFCPTVRRTEKLQKIEANEIQEKCQKIIAQYPESLLKRALSYLYTKETKSSFEIEHLQPSSTRLERFMGLLREAENEDFCSKEKLILLQNRIVEPRFSDEDYRTSQNYVGETIAFRKEKIHFVTPKPEDLPALMEGLMTTHTRMSEGNMHAIVHAATLSYGFVFLHPFEDGNGRIHRFLIHNILALEGFTPKGIMFPISAVMLKNPELYELSLESYSEKLMPLIEYTLDEEGRMHVSNETAHWYRYMDMTAQTEILYNLVQRTIETELADELQFIVNYDRTKKAIQDVIDMPDRQIDLLIRFILQNRGKLSKTKREKYFDFLNDDEIDKIEKAVWQPE
jgi:Fic family protein